MGLHTKPQVSARDVCAGQKPVTPVAASDSVVGSTAGNPDVSAASALHQEFSLRRRILVATACLVLLLAAFSAATFAWFSSSRYTNVTPVAHTVSDSGYDLLIGASESGPFDTETSLAQTDKTLYPISTIDLVNFWRGTFQNANGITTEYADCSGDVGDYALTGTFYLKGSSAPLAVYLYQSQMNVTSDSQLLAALRVGFIIEGSSGSQTYIFSCDDLGDTSGATTRRTTAEDGVVVSGSGSWSYSSDPALSVGSYTMDGSGDTPVARSGAQPLYTLATDEVARVTYFVYMEGCDANCIDEAQSRDISLQFAFAATRA